MYYYFCSEFPAVIKIDGVYFGNISQSVKPVNVMSDNQSFIELCPLNDSERALSFMLDENFLLNPPSGVLVVDLKGGFFIKFVCTGKTSPFKVLAQEKLPDAVVTVFIENGLKLSIETRTDFYGQTLNYFADGASITPFSLCGTNLVAINTTNGFLQCYILDGKISQVFCKKVASADFSNGFSTVEEFKDVAKHVLKCEWQLDGRQIKEKTRLLERAQNFCIENLNQKIIPYAFLEEFMLGGEVKDYLSENVLENSHALKEYLKDYIGIMPPPLFKNPDLVGLVYAENQNKYSVEYFSFELEDKKICNIKRSEN